MAVLTQAGDLYWETARPQGDMGLWTQTALTRRAVSSYIGSEHGALHIAST